MGSYESTMLKLEKMAQANTATQMNWQEKMSKTSHQMEVQDLIAAGLNPVLSSNQGANAYTTSVDSAVNGIANMASAREGASATRYAARQNRLAAQSAAWAQIEAAKISAKASTHNAEYTADHPQTFWGNVRQFFKDLPNGKIFGNSFSDWKGFLTDAGKTAKEIGNYISNNASDKNISDLNFSDLNSKGKGELSRYLKKLGVDNSTDNEKILFRALFKGDKKAIAKVNAWKIGKDKKRTNNASQLNFFQ